MIGDGLSPVQYDVLPDGRVRMTGVPGVAVVETVVPQQAAAQRDWLAELGIPKNWEALHALARPRGWSRRRFRAIVMDESLLRFRPPFRYRLDAIRIPATDVRLTLCHLGVVVGRLEQLYFAVEGETPGVEGQAVLALGRLYDSPLADRVWKGIGRGIFTHMCAVVLRPVTAPPGTGWLEEVALAEGEQVGCPNARLLATWEDP